MTVRDGEIKFFHMRLRWRELLIAGGISFAITLQAVVVTVILASIFRSPFMAMWLVWAGWSFSIPGAIYGGIRSRDNEEPTIYGLVAGAGVAILPGLCGALPILVFLGLGSLVTALLTAHIVYQSKRLLGFEPQVVDAPFSSLMCTHCGYWLPGLPDRRCPECGTPFGRQDVNLSQSYNDEYEQLNA